MSDAVEPVERLSQDMAEVQRRVREQGALGRHDRMRAEVLARWSEQPAPAGLRWWAWPLGTGALLAAALVLWVVVRPGPLTFQVDQTLHSGQAQAFIAAGDDEPLTVSFSDGSTLTLRPRARVRVKALHDDGASLVLESGTLEVALESPGEGAWHITAGPYEIDVLGTALTVGWGPDQGALELEAIAGETRIEGPRLQPARVVGGGDRLVILGDGPRVRAEAPAAAPSVPRHAAEIEPEVHDDDAVELIEDRAPEDPAVRARPPRRAKGRRESPADAPSGPSWRSLAREGAYAQALAAAEAAGFSGLCGSLDAKSLLELADAARYAGRGSRAREALKALRRRFAGTDAAATAAFDLGRLGTRGKGCGDASKWFEIYLRERPRGSMAAAARQRLDECTEQDKTTP